MPLGAPHLRGAGAAGHASRPHAGAAAHVPAEPRGRQVSLRALLHQHPGRTEPTGAEEVDLRRIEARLPRGWRRARSPPSSRGGGGASAWAGGGWEAASRLFFASAPPQMYPAFQFLPIRGVYKVASHFFVCVICSLLLLASGCFRICHVSVVSEKYLIHLLGHWEDSFKIKLI